MHLLFVVTNFLFYFFCKLAGVTVAMVRSQNWLGGTSVTAAGECADTVCHCADTGIRHTLEEWFVQSVTECFEKRALV